MQRRGEEGAGAQHGAAALVDEVVEREGGDLGEQGLPLASAAADLPPPSFCLQASLYFPLSFRAPFAPGQLRNRGQGIHPVRMTTIWITRTNSQCPRRQDSRDSRCLDSSRAKQFQRLHPDLDLPNPCDGNTFYIVWVYLYH